MEQFIYNVFQFFILLGLIPIVAMFLQFSLVGLNRYYNHYDQCTREYTPNISIIISAWNEADVIEKTVETLFQSDYPHEKLRLVLVDDASTDSTPEIASALKSKYPNLFFYLRREQGGQGKSHTLNFGLKHVLSDSWAEAILIVDSDILFDANAISKMVRHLVDPKVGCVTCYIKEDTTPGTIINRFIAYEYVISEAVVRRSQNVIGTLACVAGGAQLHSRANIEALGGKIDGSTLAEDTHTTFMTQILGRKAIFDGNAVVRSEEPTSISDLWKQRKRWGRGNVQLTKMFKNVWFHFSDKSGLGGIFFGLIWFSILLLPFFMILVSIGLIGTLLMFPGKAWYIFKLLAGASAFIYLFITTYSFLVDSSIFKRSWFEAIIFPGLISLFTLIIVFAPNHSESLFRSWLGASFEYWQFVFLLFVGFWVSGCMFFAWLLYRLDRAGAPRFVTNPLLVIIGYGPLLCVITLSAIFTQFSKRATQKWDKTEKIGAVPVRKKGQTQKFSFAETLKLDKRFDNRLFWKEILLLLSLIILFIIRHYSGF